MTSWADWLREETPPPASSHIRGRWIRVAQAHGRMVAHGLADRQSFEVVLGAWCNIQPGLRGDSVGILVWFYEQAEARETEACDLAEYRVRRAVWPLFDRRASREAVVGAAERANQDVLPAYQLNAVIAAVCQQATRPKQRRRA